MHLVAVHHVGGDIHERAAALAAALDMTPYEARQRLVALPAVVALAPSGHDADERVDALRDAGFRAFILEPEVSPFVKLQFPARTFEFTADAIEARSRGGETTELPYAAIRLILRGTAAHTETRETTVQQRKFSPGLAVATGGLAMRRRVKTTVRDRSEHIAGFIHIYATRGRPLILSETALDFSGLGGDMQSSRTLNMQALLRRVREVAPHATYDERLMRRGSQVQMLGPGLSPEEHLPLASALLAISAWTAG